MLEKSRIYGNSVQNYIPNINVPVEFYYPKETHENEDIKFPNILLQTEVNRLTIDTAVSPSQIEITYYKKQ